MQCEREFLGGDGMDPVQALEGFNRPPRQRPLGCIRAGVWQIRYCSPSSALLTACDEITTDRTLDRKRQVQG